MVRVRWYFTDLPFLESPTIYGSSFYRDDKTDDGFIGEQWNPRPPYAGALVVAGLSGEHVCGSPAQFEEPLAWPYTGPPVEYDAQGIPLCCGRAPVAFLATGAAPAALVRSWPRPRGKVTTGAYPASRAVRRSFRAAEVATGAAPGALVELIPALGRRPATGAAPRAAVTRTSTRPAAVGAGAAPGALVELIPPGPPGPGPTCAAAFVATADTLYEYTASATVSQWWRFNIGTSASALYSIDFGGGGASWELYEGECGSLNLLSEGAGTSSVFVESAPSGSLLVRIFGGADPYSLIVYLF